MLHAINPFEFRARWQLWYPDAEPLGWVMREEYSDRWLRIHSLAEGKRYPTSDSDLEVIIERHNTVADAVLGDAPAALLTYDFGGSDKLQESHPLHSQLSDAPPVMRIVPEDEDADPTSVFGAILEWKPSLLDAQLLDVAMDRLRLMLVNWDTGAAYAPYDGGADLFFPSLSERDAAGTRFRDWLSGHPSKL